MERKTEDEGIGTATQVEFSRWFLVEDSAIHNEGCELRQQWGTRRWGRNSQLSKTTLNLKGGKIKERITTTLDIFFTALHAKVEEEEDWHSDTWRQRKKMSGTRRQRYSTTVVS